MITTAWQLGGLDQYDGLNLRRWAHMLGFRGHFLTKSRRYSTTFSALRERTPDLAAARRPRPARPPTPTTPTTSPPDLDTVTVINDWWPVHTATATTPNANSPPPSPNATAHSVDTTVNRSAA